MSTLAYCIHFAPWLCQRTTAYLRPTNLPQASPIHTLHQRGTAHLSTSQQHKPPEVHQPHTANKIKTLLNWYSRPLFHVTDQLVNTYWHAVEGGEREMFRLCGEGVCHDGASTCCQSRSAASAPAPWRCPALAWCCGVQPSLWTHTLLSSSQISNTASGGTSTHGTRRLTPTTC